MVVATVLVATSVLVGGLTAATGSPSAEASSSPPSIGNAQAIFDRSGTPPIFGANELVEIYAGTISFVGGRPPGEKLGACAAVPASLNTPGVERAHPGIDDFFQPFADVYIVPAGQAFTGDQRLRDAAGAPNSVIGGIGGGYVFEPLGITFPTGRISAGRYDLVVDECQNGYFDDGEDSVIRDAFQVQLQQNVPPLDPAAAQFLNVKAQAQDATRAGDSIDQLIKTYKTYKAAKELYGAVTAPIKTMVTIIGGQVLGAFGVTNPYTELKKWGEGVRDQVMAQVRTRTRRIAADPPQADYKRFAVPIVAGAAFDDGRTELDEAMAAYIANVDAMSGISVALLDAMERYQGADEVGDALWALRHARTLQELAPLQEAVSVALDASAVRLAALLDARTDGFVFASTISNADRAVDQVLQGGNAEVSADVLNAGLPADDLPAKVDDWERRVVGANVADLNSPAEWADAIEESTAEFASFLAAGADMATLADGLVPQLEAETGDTDTDPMLDITVTGTPVAGGTVTATAAPVPTGVEVEWDLDADGEFDDATGATTDWTLPGDALVGSPLFISARVVGIDGETGADGAIELVVVGAGGNRAPEIPLADIAEPGRFEVAPGGSAAITVTATDPDGDPLTYEWFVEDQPQAETTNSFTFTTPGDRVGAYAIEVFVSDDAGATTRATFLVEAVTEDLDSDGYMAAPGPDCLDDPAAAPTGVISNRVNPGRDELANSYDDDCDGIVDEETGGTMSTVPERAVDFEPTIQTGNNVTEGDQVSLRTTWSHANQYLGPDNDGNYRMTWDFGDGTTRSQLLAGTTFDEMRRFVFESHQYAEQSAAHYVQMCWEWLDDPAEVNLRRCTSVDNQFNEFQVLNDRPFVNAADLRTWSESQVVPPTFNGAPGGQPTWDDLDPDGRGVIANGNPSNGLVVANREPIGPGGYGRFAVSHEVLEPGDNDLIGAVFGFDPNFDVDPVAANGPEGEGFDPDAEFIGAIWGNEAEDLGGQNRNYNPFDECGGSAPDVSVDPDIDPLTVWKQQGLPSYLETTALLTFDVPDATEPTCADADGITRLGSIDGDLDPDETVMADVWRVRTLDGNAAGTLVTDPYFVEYEYLPDSITIWVNGVEQGRIDNPGPDPFPPANGGLFTRSQGAVRASASAPEPVFQFVQGKGGEFWDTDPATGDPVLPDGISMPMTDGPADEHTATISWGDGTAATEGTVTPDPATGFGWFTITGDHVYDTPGEYRGSVCAEDDEGLGSCFPFRAIVDNAPPRVDAGTDRTVGAGVTLADMTFQDPGATDTHTASIDWGDGTVTAGVIEAERGGGTVTGTHTFSAGGEYTVELCVTDAASATTCDTRVLTVRDGAADARAPEVSIEDASTSPNGAGGEATLGALATDWNVDDTLTASIDWGDGTVEAPASTRSGVGCDDPNVTPDSDPATTTVDPDCQLFAALSGAHTYDANGSYDVVIEVCDRSGRCDTDRVTLTITAVQEPEPEPEPSVPFLVPLTPARVLETRTGPGLTTIDDQFENLGERPGQSEIELQITGRGGVPATGVDAAVINIGAVKPAGTGFFTVYPCGERPNASGINYGTGNIANEIIAKLSPDGTICIYNQTTTHIIADVTGYIPTGSDYVPLTPARVLETRTGPGLTTIDDQFENLGPRPGQSEIELQITGRGGIPATGVDAAVINIGAVKPAGTGFFTVYPCGERPNASGINYGTGNIANEIIAKLSPDGTICIYNQTTTHIIADVTGYIPTGSDYAPLTPARVLETRTGPGLTTIDDQFENLGARPGQSEIELQITGRGGVPATGVDAAVINIGAVKPAGTGFFTVHPCGERPNASGINYGTGNIANEIIAKLSPDGTICIYNQTTTHIIADVTGYIPTT